MARWYNRESKTPIDLIKIATFVVAFPAAAATLARALWGDKAPEVSHTAEAGIALGIGVAFSKQVGNAWKVAASVACNTPEQIRHSFLVYYVKETAHRKAKAAIAVFKSGSQSIFQHAAAVPSRIRKFGKKFFAPKEP